MKIRCSYCSGSGMQLGKGMIRERCKQCVEGWINDEPLSKQKIDKRSKSYKDAVANIKKARDGMTDKEAEKLFEEAMENI